MKITSVICISMLCLAPSSGWCAGKVKESPEFKIKVAKNKLEALEIRVAKNTSTFKDLNQKWIEQVNKLKELGVNIDYDFGDVVK